MKETMTNKVALSSKKLGLEMHCDVQILKIFVRFA